MSLTLFVVLVFVNTILFRNKFLESFGKLELPRINSISSELDNNSISLSTPNKIEAKLDSLSFEYNIDIYDQNGKWIAGAQSYLNEKIVKKEFSKTLHNKNSFTRFVKIFYNENMSSPFHAIKIHLKFVDSPIFNSEF